MAGFDAPYVPGYDCHGLPIELKVDRELGPKKREMSVADFRRACRAYAERYIGVMTEEFQRLGILGDWEHPVPDDELQVPGGDRARARASSSRRGWSTRARSRSTGASTAAPRWRKRKSSTRSTPRRRSTSSSRWRRTAPTSSASRIPELKGRDVSVLIWTTTPWTIPSNLAIAFHPEFDYAAYEVGSRAIIVAEALAPKVAEAGGVTFGRAGRALQGEQLEQIRFLHPLYARISLGVLGDYVTLDAGTGAVHTAPGHGSDDFNTGVRYGLDIYAPVGPGGHFLDTVDMFAGQRVFDANPNVEQALKERGAPVAPRRRSRTSTRTAGAATTR